MEGSELTKQEKISKLADEFNIFTSEKRRDDSFILHKDKRVVVLNVQGRQAQGYGNAGRGGGMGNIKVVRTVGDLSAIPPKVIRFDGLEGFDSDYEELQLHATSIPMTEKVDAYDSKVDDAPTANAIFMAKLSPDGSINEDEVGSSYDSDILSEVPNYETYHANDMFNPFVQELLVSKQLVSVNDTYVDFLSDSNVISDNPYPNNNENEVVQEMASLAQNDVAILLLIENMQHEVTRCNTVNLESKQINEQLTIELDKYTKQVKVLESEKKNQLVFTFTEKDLDSQMRKLIVGSCSGVGGKPNWGGLPDVVGGFDEEDELGSTLVEQLTAQRRCQFDEGGMVTPHNAAPAQRNANGCIMVP
ncbi:hypothetical protein Tco_1508774 [Tanacetum coccineum]